MLSLMVSSTSYLKRTKVISYYLLSITYYLIIASARFFTLHSSLFTLHFLMSYASNPARYAARHVRSNSDNGGILRTAHWSH